MVITGDWTLPRITRTLGRTQIPERPIVTP
jgi:hypothetical protein